LPRALQGTDPGADITRQIAGKRCGYPVRPEDEVRLSPFGHGNINMLGRYSFAMPVAVARGELRPLRDSTDP